MTLLVAELRPARAQAVPAVLRGRALEIVDAQGRVRASISVEPPTTVDARNYPETVLVRLTDPKNGPVVKLTASAEGSALSLSDDSRGGVQVSAKSAGSFVKVVSRDGREEVITPSR
jgi:hypothetical protein